MGLALGMNLHDGDGVQQKDNPGAWPAFAAALGLPANASGAPFAIGERAYADALAGAVMAPLMAGFGGAPPEGGLDLCWTDWQQGFPGVSSVPGLVPTAILNHYRFYNCTGSGRGTRGTLHSRYAGRGDHRHTSHFGGDVDESWASLQFMIDFTKTAANAPACWWGHEMMRQGGGINQNSELFVRTNQFGAWSPTFTSWGNSGENNFWWNMPKPFASAMRGSLLDRQRLLPLRYTLAAHAARTGLCPIRGMHFAAPLHPDAYATPGQYLLGLDLIVAPPFAPVSDPPIPLAGGAPGGVVGVRMWVPPGATWLDYNDGAARSVAGGWITYNASISVVPVLVRAGAVVPTLPRAYAAVWGVSARNYDALVFTVFPGAPSGGTAVYEDDGATTGFLRGEAANTSFAYGPSGGKGCTAYTLATRGAYQGMITSGRAYTVELVAAPAPTAVTQNGTPLPEKANEGVPGTWARRGGVTTVVSLLPAETGTDVELVVC
jgi:alpha-glucosidase (family GH31 glycosyl hydrolase)